MFEVKHYPTRTTLSNTSTGVELWAWNIGWRGEPKWEVFDEKQRDPSGSNYVPLGTFHSRQAALIAMCQKAKAPEGTDIVSYTKCTVCKSTDSYHRILCTRYEEGEREPRKERAPRPQQKVQDAPESLVEPATKVQLRTNVKGSENRNPQLADGEIQVECSRGAVSVCLDTAPARGGTETVTVCTVRGLPGRQAQIVEMDLDELDAFLAVLQKARGDLRKHISDKRASKLVVGETYQIVSEVYTGSAVYVKPYPAHPAGSTELPWYVFKLPNTPGFWAFPALYIQEQE